MTKLSDRTDRLGLGVGRARVMQSLCECVVALIYNITREMTNFNFTGEMTKFNFTGEQTKKTRFIDGAKNLLHQKFLNKEK